MLSPSRPLATRRLADVMYLVQDEERSRPACQLAVNAHRVGVQRVVGLDDAEFALALDVRPRTKLDVSVLQKGRMPLPNESYSRREDDHAVYETRRAQVLEHERREQRLA